MSISSNSYLVENNPRANLALLSGFEPSDTSGTKCTTEKACLKVPKTNISLSTLRELCLIGGAATFLTMPLFMTAGKMTECAGKTFRGDLLQAYQCVGEMISEIAPKIQMVNLLTLGSLLAFGGLGVYSAARYYFQDKAQGERFELLNREYSAAAQCLIEQYASRNPSERAQAKEAAKRLANNKELIRLSLVQVVRLTEPQANLLAAKLDSAARTILQKEGEISQKIPVAAPIPKKPTSNSFGSVVGG